MEIKIKDVEHFISSYNAFLKVREVLYAPETCAFVNRTSEYEDLVDALLYFLRRTAKTEDTMVIDAKLGVVKIKEILQKEQDVLLYEEKEKEMIEE